MSAKSPAQPDVCMNNMPANKNEMLPVVSEIAISKSELMITKGARASTTNEEKLMTY